MSSDSSFSAAPSLPWWRAAVEVLLIFAVFFLHGAWPVPDVNEPHYLSKAKHYWNSDWCQKDFFVNTADAHQVFYWTFGWTTKFLSLEQAAWLGRLLTWALLAWAWRRLSWAVLPRAWLAVLSAELFVMLTENAHMAGEWIIGGVEAKGFAYVLVLLGLEAVIRSRWNTAWLLIGAAGCFHVIVGGWAALAAMLAWLKSPRERPTFGAMLPGLIGGLLLALPGLLFAISLTRGVDPDIVRQANTIYVWDRLPHHLAADRFKEGFPTRHLMMWGLLLVLVTVTPADARQRKLRWFVGGTMLLTLTGYLIVWIATWAPDTAAALLRFYWFRMSDVFVPLGVVLVGLTFVEQLGMSRPAVRRLWLTGLIVLSCYDLWLQVAHLPFNLVDRAWTTTVPRSDKSLVYDDWLKTCEWIKEHAPPDAVFITPRMSATLRWYADRAEIGNWKDIPQDSAKIVEWWNRMLEIHTLDPKANPPKFIESIALLGSARINQLGAKYGASYAIVPLLPDTPPLAAKPEFPQNLAGHAYAVYKLPLAEK